MAAVVGWTDWDELCAASPEQDGGAKTCANSLGTLLHSDGAISHHFLDMISWGGVGGRRREGGVFFCYLYAAYNVHEIATYLPNFENFKNKKYILYLKFR